MTRAMTPTMTSDPHDGGAKLIRLACSLADYAPWRQSPDMDALKSAVQQYRATRARCTFCRAELPGDRVKYKACVKCEQEYKDGYALAERIEER